MFSGGRETVVLATVGSRKFWSEFIDLYKSLPETWQVKNEKYKNRQLKSDAYDKLVEKLREIEETADRATVIKRINNLRVCYRRELKKVLISEKAATCVDDVYVPSLWYYNRLNFLRTINGDTGGWDDNDQSETVSDNEDILNYENEEDHTNDKVYANVKKRSLSPEVSSKAKIKKSENTLNTNELIIDETPVDYDVLCRLSTSAEPISKKKSSVKRFCEFLALQITDAKLSKPQISALQIELLKKVHEFIPK